MLNLEKAYIGLLKQIVVAAEELKTDLAPAVSHILGKKLKSDRRFKLLKEGKSLVELSSLTVKGAVRGKAAIEKQNRLQSKLLS